MQADTGSRTSSTAPLRAAAGWLVRQTPLALDVRALAALRAGLGLLLLCSTLAAWGALLPWLSDHGALPRALLAAHGDPARLSLHLVNGTLAWSMLLLFVQLIAALALMFGWRARAAAFVAFVLAASLANRNPLIVSAGDSWLIALLFWASLVPIGARWSLDASVGTPPEEPAHRSWAGLALRLQLLALPLLSVAALGDALSLPAVALSVALVALIAGLLPLRGAGLVALLLIVVFALAFLLPVGAGWSALVLLVATALLAPASLFERLDRLRARRQPHGRLRIYYDRDCAFCERSCRILATMLILRDCDVVPAQAHARAEALRAANDSWVVIDREDRAFLKWPAMRALLSASPLTGWMLRLPGTLISESVGNRAYDAVVAHRAAWGRATAFLAPRPVRWAPRPAVQRVAAAIGLLMVIWQLGQLGVPPGLDRAVSLPMRMLRLDTLAPQPPADASLLPRLQLADASLVDPRAPDADPAVPLSADQAGVSTRSARYAQRLRLPTQAPLRPRYAQWWCTRWNRGRAADDPSRAVEARLVELLPAGDGVRGEQRVLLRESCARAE